MKNISVTRFENLRYEDKRYLKFQIVNTHVSYVNTLRRVGISEVKSVGFRAEILKDGSTSDVKIESNTTPMSNEMLAHRIGLIPVHANPSTWDPEKYVFKCDIKNNSLDFIKINKNTLRFFL